jgi:arylsulfatase A-like enzyme
LKRNDPSKELAGRGRATFASTLGAIAAGLMSALAIGCSHEPSPNVVLIVLDTVRADGVGGTFNDRPVTPALDGLAAAGTRFDRAYSTAPWTLPSHASLFTGLAPTQHKAVHENFALAASHRTLAESLSEHGYLTYGITSNPWVTSGRGLAQGFQKFEAAYSQEPEATDKGASRAAQLATGFIAGAASQAKPFFLFVNLLEAHLPYAPPDAGFAALGIAPDSLTTRDYSIERAEEIITGERTADAVERTLAQTLYTAEIAYQDQQLAVIIDTLTSHQILDNTLIIVTADHGELLGEGGMMGHEFSLADPVLNVPLVVRYPSRFAGGIRSELPVSHLDILPTVVDIVGIEHTLAPTVTTLAGASLVDHEALPLNRDLVAEYSHPVTLLTQYWATRHPDFDTESYAVSLRSLRRGARKLVEDSRGARELRDPQDTRVDDTEVAEQMRDALGQWTKRLGGNESPPAL